jgi:uncharacterized protein (DUF58 family)
VNKDSESRESRAKRVAERIRRVAIGTRRLSTDAFHGGVQSRFRGRGMDFDEVREYEPGDDVRAIDWSATARAGHTFVKKYREERQLTVLFVVDLSASGSVGSASVSKRDLAVELASVLALSAIHSDHRIGLIAFTDAVECFVPPARGRSHAFRLVNQLVTLEPRERGTNLARALRFTRDHLKRRAVVVVLSDFLLGEQGLERAESELRLLGNRHDVVAIRVGDALDRELPAVGLLTIEDAETGAVFEIDTGSAKRRDRIGALARDENERIRWSLRRARVDLLEVDTLIPYLGPLIGFFRARGGRA